jgi:hypothetical protein
MRIMAFAMLFEEATKCARRAGFRGEPGQSALHFAVSSSRRGRPAMSVRVRRWLGLLFLGAWSLVFATCSVDMSASNPIGGLSGR